MVAALNCREQQSEWLQQKKPAVTVCPWQGSQESTAEHTALAESFIPFPGWRPQYVRQGYGVSSTGTGGGDCLSLWLCTGPQVCRGPFPRCQYRLHITSQARHPTPCTAALHECSKSELPQNLWSTATAQHGQWSPVTHIKTEQFLQTSFQDSENTELGSTYVR